MDQPLELGGRHGRAIERGWQYAFIVQAHTHRQAQPGFLDRGQQALARRIGQVESPIVLEGPAQVSVEIGRVQGPIGDIVNLCQAFGAERVLFGSNLPLHAPESATISVEAAEVSAEVKAGIRAGNLRKLLGL
ncbi:MAG: hypothetical protein CL878_01390 [Dehalococcoidia bacterium]|nr:hypothetical protein [Dehalococcoidia bacterium]